MAVEAYRIDSGYYVIWFNGLSGAVNVCLVDAFTHCLF